MGRLLTITQAADLLDVAYSTVRYYRETGKLTALKNSQGSLRFDEDEVLNLKAGRRAFVPAVQRAG